MRVEAEVGILGYWPVSQRVGDGDQISRWWWVELSNAVESLNARLLKVSIGLDELITIYFSWRGWKTDCRE